MVSQVKTFIMKNKHFTVVTKLKKNQLDPKKTCFM